MSALAFVSRGGIRKVNGHHIDSGTLLFHENFWLGEY